MKVMKVEGRSDEIIVPNHGLAMNIASDLALDNGVRHRVTVYPSETLQFLVKEISHARPQ